MALSRKSYELIAGSINVRVKALREALPESSELRKVSENAIYNVARELSINLAVDNPRFDRERFMKASGFTGEWL